MWIINSGLLFETCLSEGWHAGTPIVACFCCWRCGVERRFQIRYVEQRDTMEDLTVEELFQTLWDYSKTTKVVPADDVDELTSAFAVLKGKITVFSWRFRTRNRQRVNRRCHLHNY